MKLPSFGCLRGPTFGIAASLLLASGCRSDDATANKGTPGSAGTVQSAPVVPPADNSAFPYQSPSTQKESDLAHRHTSDAGLSLVAPIVLRDDSRLSADSLAGRDTTGITLDAEWKAGDWPAPANAPETDRERLTELRDATRWSMRVDLASSGRMSLQLKSQGFAWENGTELRARVDLLGHYVVWPNQTRYRPLPPGSLRQLLEDGRADVGELLLVTGKSLGAGHWLEWDTERVLVSSVFGHVTLDRAIGLSAGVSGRLLCRLLIELINGDPSSELCQDDAIPLRAAFEFPSGGKGEFAVSRVTKKQEFSPSAIGVPPPNAAPNYRDLPRGTQLSGLRLSAIRNRATLPDHVRVTHPGVGLVATNHTLGLRTLLIDGIVAAWLWPGEVRNIPELVPGQYSVAWRDFMGMYREAPTKVTVPAQITVGPAP